MKKVKATSIGTLPTQAAASFARLLAVAMAKKPELRVVEKKDKAA